MLYSLLSLIVFDRFMATVRVEQAAVSTEGCSPLYEFHTGLLTVDV